MTAFSDFVYFIKPVGMDGPIKIGWSKLPARRLLSLSVWSPFKLELLHVIPGSFALEQTIHRCLWRSHSHNEWFQSTDEVRAFVEKLLNGLPVEEAIDLSSATPRERRKYNYTPVQRQWLSYCHRIAHAVKRAEKQCGKRKFPCKPASEAMDRWRETDERPLDTEIALIEAFIDNPVKNGRSLSKMMRGA
jgi:hypothetical protein